VIQRVKHHWKKTLGKPASALLLVTLLCCPAAGVRPGQGKLPTFKDFPVSPRYRGKPAPVRLVTQQARMYRTVLREGARHGPNFAGHYTIVTWGCGTSCLEFAIVDARTGNVYFPPFDVAFGSNLKQERLQRSDEPLQFHTHSRLLIVTGSRSERGEGRYFYRWDGNRLQLVASADVLK
jgi:hypothetical protein